MPCMRSSNARMLTASSSALVVALRSLLELLVWKEYSSGEQELFLSLMTSAGICFISRPADKKLGVEAEYVAPDLLPEKGAVASDLAGRWDEQAPFHTLCYR